MQFTNAIYRVIINRKLKKAKEVSIHLTMGAFFVAVKEMMLMWPKHKRIKNKKLIAEMRKPYCELCGERTTIESHHVNTVGSGGGDIAINLIQLCTECHIKAHSGLINKEVCEHMIAMREGIPYEEVHRLNRKAMGYDV